MKKNILLGLCTILFVYISSAQINLIPFGSTWKYLDDGSDQGMAWTAISFDDASWKTGPAKLGYGNGDEATVVSYGADAKNKYTTTYFRKSISIADPSSFISFSANIRRDDGVVVYINGVEVYRNNMPTGNISYKTLASTSASYDGYTPQSFSLNASSFIKGSNEIAVEIHQYSYGSGDISFDFELLGSPNVTIATTDTTLIPYKSTWKYLDDGSDQGTIWATASFDDALWKSGAAKLGYGDGDEATVVSYGGDPNNKFTTTYFRKSISITDAALFSNYYFKVRRDDGVVVYVNGKEVYRNNMPTGVISYKTLAASSASDDGDTAKTFKLNASAFVSGNNVIAIEIHQYSYGSADISFDLKLIGYIKNAGTQNSTIIRGPYLQMASEDAVTLRWRTDIPTDSKAEAGTSFGQYTLAAINPKDSTEHEVRINGLLPNTKYFYRIGNSAQNLQEGADQFFTTAPAESSTQKIRIAAFGDCGRYSATQIKVLNAYLNYVNNAPAELMLLLGDNAYEDGTDSDYQSGFFIPYGNTILKNHVLFPTPGNHDYNTSTRGSRDAPYYKCFTTPTAGECGGVASGDEAYYSFNWGNIHFLSLDSHGAADHTRLYDTLGPQVSWVKKDLEANTRPWVIAYWHHPPFTMGSHNSDTETELTKIRENFIRILERYGVDLVLCGHSHVYERSYLLKGYYGTEDTFDPGIHTASTSSAQYNGALNSCPYATTSGQTSHGTVYVVSGSAANSGATVEASFPHEALPFATTAGGMLYLEVEGNRLDAKFIREDKTVFDQFTIMKEVNKTSALTIMQGASATLTASWIGNYNWSNGAVTQSITVTPDVNVDYTVTDGSTCLVDTFKIQVMGTPASVKGWTTEKDGIGNSGKLIQSLPTLVKKGQDIVVRTSTYEVIEASLIDNNGRLIRVFTFTGSTAVNTNKMAAGTYFLILKSSNKRGVHRLVVTN